MLKDILKPTEFLKDRISARPEIGIILGSGLGGLVKKIEITHSFDYSEIPNFPLSTVEGHAGKLLFGKLGRKNVVAMQGRFHFYEGYTMHQVVLPVRVMKLLGIKSLLLSNASGGVNPSFEIGDIMIQDDHINLFPSNPLMGPNIDELGPRFPDMSEPYSRKMIALAEKIASKHAIKVQKGVYAGVSGPALETPAEYKYVRAIGADAVGMSTVPEVIAARHMGIPCFALSVITDLGVPGKIIEITHELVQEVAGKTEPKMSLLIEELVKVL
ncbi:MAG: purine-nucleoside phosphorylase [Flavobacteriales bacterium]|nr:purine-nucleoside phosphorylase [Flavobacteriales bacterium]